MKTLRLTFAATVVTVCMAANAQDNGLNPVYKVVVGDLEYKVQTATTQTKPKVGMLIGKIVQANSGITTNNDHSEQVMAVSDAVKSGISNVRRLETTDGLADAPDYDIAGEITNISTTTKEKVSETKDSNGKVEKKKTYEYTGHIGVTLNMRETGTGKITTKTFSVSDNSEGTSENSVLTVCINRLRDRVANYYNSMFPLRANIIERGSANKKETKIKEAYIDLGANASLYEGQVFTVYVVGIVAGRETHKEIGKLRVKEVQGDDISLCRVSSGGKDILEALNAKKSLLVVSE